MTLYFSFGTQNRSILFFSWIFLHFLLWCTTCIVSSLLHKSINSRCSCPRLFWTQLHALLGGGAHGCARCQAVNNLRNYTYNLFDSWIRVRTVPYVWWKCGKDRTCKHRFVCCFQVSNFRRFGRARIIPLFLIDVFRLDTYILVVHLILDIIFAIEATRCPLRQVFLEVFGFEVPCFKLLAKFYFYGFIFLMLNTTFFLL